VFHEVSDGGNSVIEFLDGIGDFRWGENNRAQEQAIESMACIMFAPALPAAEKKHMGYTLILRH